MPDITEGKTLHFTMKTLKTSEFSLQYHWYRYSPAIVPWYSPLHSEVELTKLIILYKCSLLHCHFLWSLPLHLVYGGDLVLMKFRSVLKFYLFKNSWNLFSLLETSGNIYSLLLSVKNCLNIPSKAHICRFCFSIYL